MDLTCTSAFVRRLSGRGSIGGREGSEKEINLRAGGAHRQVPLHPSHSPFCFENEDGDEGMDTTLERWAPHS